MQKKIDLKEISPPKNQLNLFGYKDYFNSFLKLHKNQSLPKTLLLSGPKGLGKSTFAYHIINYILSQNEEDKYLLDKFIINEKNKSYKLLIDNIHPNFFLIDSNHLEKDIKIEQIRNLSKFLSKTTYSKEIKIILIDNVEFLNLNASNALLKALEEPPANTFFFVIHNSAVKIPDTIKSRCTNFKIFFTLDEKINIFNNLINQYGYENDEIEEVKNCYFDTPGNVLKYFTIISDQKIEDRRDSLFCIFFFMQKYSLLKDPEILPYIFLHIQKFYNEIIVNLNKNLPEVIFNYSKILNLLNNMKKFNLSIDNTFLSIRNILINEKV